MYVAYIIRVYDKTHSFIFLQRRFREDNFEKAMAFLQDEGSFGGGKKKKGGYRQGR